MEEKKEFTITVFTENQVGLISKIATMFSRRKISLESFNTSPTEFENIYRFTIVLNERESFVDNLVKQIAKIVEVLTAYYNTEDEIIWQQLALYKLPTEKISKEVKVERLLRSQGAQVVVIRNDYTVFAVTGQETEIQEALKSLTENGLIEFVQSSRVALMKSNAGIHQYINQIEEKNPTKDPVNNQYLHRRSEIFDLW